MGYQLVKLRLSSSDRFPAEIAPVKNGPKRGSVW